MLKFRYLDSKLFSGPSEDVDFLDVLPDDQLGGRRDEVEAESLRDERKRPATKLLMVSQQTNVDKKSRRYKYKNQNRIFAKNAETSLKESHYRPQVALIYLDCSKLIERTNINYK
jgi:hypothetical protein